MESRVAKMMMSSTVSLTAGSFPRHAPAGGLTFGVAEALAAVPGRRCVDRGGGGAVLQVPGGLLHRDGRRVKKQIAAPLESRHRQPGRHRGGKQTNQDTHTKPFPENLAGPPTRSR